MDNGQSTSNYQGIGKENIIFKSSKERLESRISMFKECLNKIYQYRIENTVTGTNYTNISFTEIGYLIDDKKYDEKAITKELEILELLNKYI